MSATPVIARIADLRALRFHSSHAQGSDSVIIWLHGIGERGNDLPAVAKYGLPAALLAGRASSNCDVFCPQLPPEQLWWPNLVQALVDAAKANHSNVALVGFSLGGQGVLNHHSAYGPTCSLHVAVAPDEPSKPTAACRGASLVVVQGERDFHQGVADYVAEAKILGASASESVVPGGDHFISESWLHRPEVQAALCAHSLNIELHEA